MKPNLVEINRILGHYTIIRDTVALTALGLFGSGIYGVALSMVG